MNISYQEYRQHQEQLAHRKEKILKINNEKLEAHRKYRKYHNLYLKKTKEYDKEVMELLKIVPSKV